MTDSLLSSSSPPACVGCCLCEVNDTSKATLYFLPADTEPEALVIHLFCGKTAPLSLGGRRPRPELEVLGKSQLKRKHSSASADAFRAALAKTRCAEHRDSLGKTKQFYLATEFAVNIADLERQEAQEAKQQVTEAASFLSLLSNGADLHPSTSEPDNDSFLSFPELGDPLAPTMGTYGSIIKSPSKKKAQSSAKHKPWRTPQATSTTSSDI